MTKICGIYCIENKINGKKYIGLSRDIKGRWQQHQSDLNKNKHPNPHLQHSWNKYGHENFKFWIVEVCMEDKLSNREVFNINFYHTKYYENGYNLTPGGEDVTSWRTVIRLKDSKVYDYVYEAAADANVASITMIDWCRRKCNYMYYEEYLLLSEEEKTYWCEYDWDAYYHYKRSRGHSRKNLSESTLLKYSQAASGTNNPRATRVYCPELDEYFDYIQLAHEKYGFSAGSIGQCIRGVFKHAGFHPVTGEKLTWIKA